MKAIVFIFIVLTAVASRADVIITYDSRRDALPPWAQARAVDISNRDPATNPDFRAWMFSHTTPALIDVQTQISVVITGTMQQARADLQRSLLAAFPAIVRERGIDRRESARSVRDDNRVTGAALRVQVRRMAELIEELQERVERLESREAE